MKRWFCLLVVLVLSFGTISVLAETTEMGDKDLLVVTFIDVRMGDCILLSCNGETMLVDGGESRRAFLIKDYFNKIGLKSLDYMLNTHCHDDHIEGLYRLVKDDFPVKKYLSPYGADYKWDLDQVKMHDLILQKNITYQKISHGDVFFLGKTKIEVFRDERPMRDKNSHSVVLMVTFGEINVLLMADAGGSTQKYFLSEFGGGRFKADILKYAHHGYMAMYTDFVKSVDPSLAIVTNNKKTAWKCENQLRFQKIDRFYTQSGTVVIKIDGKDWTSEQLPMYRNNK